MNYIEWLAKNGFEKSPQNTDVVVEHWFRASKYGVDRCRSNKDKPMEISVSRDPRVIEREDVTLGEFSMQIIGDNGNYWMECNAFSLTEDMLVKKGRDIEMRLVDAWRGFN